MNSSFQDGYSQSFAPSPSNYNVARGPTVGLKLGSKKVWCGERDLPAQLQGAGRGPGRLRGWVGDVGGRGPAPLPQSDPQEVSPAARRCSRRSSARPSARAGAAPSWVSPPGSRRWEEGAESEAGEGGTLSLSLERLTPRVSGSGETTSFSLPL